MAKKRRTKTQQTKITYFFFGFLVCVGALLAILVATGQVDVDAIYGALGIQTSEETIAVGDGEMAVHFIDVGQGDAVLITSPEQNILIDAGENDRADTVVNYLKKQKVKTLDLVIGTHPHSDHIGGLDKVINTFEVKNVMMPKIPAKQVPTTKTYEDVLLAVKNKGLKIQAPTAGQQYSFKGGKLTFVGPGDSTYSNLNDYSICVRLQYGDTFFLFTGDAEKAAEKDMVNGGAKLKADVYKAGHHGSSTSNTQEFLDKIQPKYVVISTGTGNSYGHPHKEALQRFEKMGARVYRTDLNKTVVVMSDGEKITVKKAG